MSKRGFVRATLAMILAAFFVAGGNTAACATDVDFGPYMADLQRRIKACWFPPVGNESRRVVVYFTIMGNGREEKLRIDKTSERLLADDAGLQAVLKASPFRPLPDGAPSQVDIQFTFDYNVFSTNKVDKAQKDVEEAEKLSGVKDNRDKLASAYRTLGTAYAMEAAMEKANEAYGKALELREAINGKGSMKWASVLCVQARYLYLNGDKKDYNSALKMLNVAQKAADESKHEAASAYVDRLRAELIEEPQGKLEEAAKSLNSASVKAKSFGSAEDYQESQIQLADFYVRQDKLQKACDLLNTQVAEAMLTGPSQYLTALRNARLLTSLYISKKQDPGAAIALADTIHDRFIKMFGENAPQTLKALELCITTADKANDKTAVAKYQKEHNRLSAKPATVATNTTASEKGKVDPKAIKCNNQGVVFLLEKNFKDAASKFREAMLIDPEYGLARINFATAQNNWAIQDTSAHDYSSAAKHLRRSLFARPSENATAEEDLKAVCAEVAPGTDHRARAKVCEGSGDFIGAVVEYKFAVNDKEGSDPKGLQDKVQSLLDKALTQFADEGKSN